MSDKKYNCNICNKDYKTSQSLWNHKNKYHKSKSESQPEIYGGKLESKPTFEENNSDIENNKKYKCRFCSNKYLFKQSRWKHEQKCNKKNDLEELIKQNEEKDKQIEEIKQSFEKFKQQMIDMINKN